MKTNHKKTPMIHLDKEDLFAYPKWFLLKYSHIEALLISQILYYAQIGGGSCRITDSELAEMFSISLYPIRILRDKIITDKNFAPFISILIRENDRRGGTFFNFSKETFKDFEVKIKEGLCIKDTDKQYEKDSLSVGKIQINNIINTDKQYGTYQAPYIVRARVESIRKNKKENPQTPLRGGECIDLSKSGLKKKTPVTSSRFKEWYDHYPRKVSLGAAEKAFHKLEKESPQIIQTIIDRTILYQKLIEEKGVEKQFIPHPATWLNAKRWEDEDLNVEATPRKKTVEEYRAEVAERERIYYEKKEREKLNASN